MTPSSPKTFRIVTTTGSSSSTSSSSSSNNNSSSSTSSGPASSATPPPFDPLVHARFGLGDFTDSLGSLLWADLTLETTSLVPPATGPTAATPTKATPSSDAAAFPSIGAATGSASGTKAAAASTAAVSLSTTASSSTVSITTPSASPSSSSSAWSTTGHEALVAHASSSPSTSTSTSNSTGESGGLRPGDLAGIAIAAHVVLTVCIGLGLWHYRHKYRQLRDKERRRQLRQRRAAGIVERASSTGYDDDEDEEDDEDEYMIASRKTASSSTILEMKRLRIAGGGGRAASKGSLSALELLDPETSPTLTSGHGSGRADHRGAAMSWAPFYESPVIRPPSPLRLKGSDLRRKKPHLNSINTRNDFAHAGNTTTKHSNQLFQEEEDEDGQDDDAASSCYHYADVADDRRASFGPAGGGTRTPLLHLPNLSFHTLDLMADGAAVKAVKCYSVASPIRTPVPAHDDDDNGDPGGDGWPASHDGGYSGRGSAVRLSLVASVAGSVVGRKSDDEEDGRGRGGSGGGETHGASATEGDEGARMRAPRRAPEQEPRVSWVVKGGPEGPKSPQSPPKIWLYPKPYKGW